MPTALRLATVAVAVLLLLVACTTEEQAASPESGDFSGPDVAFLQGMIPHHEDGVAMAALVEERSERDELRALARDIVDRQREQAQEMRTLLERAGAQQPDEDAGEGEHDELGEALTEDERTELRNLDGTPFDLTFLDRMIAHHDSAIRDAQRHLDRGDHPEVIALAERIVGEQSAEVEQMERWRDEWAAEDPLD
jgi:uncharacterized protein (DUF305 family)